MIRFLVPRQGEFCIADYLSSWGKALAGTVDILHYEDLPARTSLPPGTYIFTGLERLTPGGTRLVCELQDQLRSATPPMPVLNDPRRALLRYQLLQELYRVGLNQHRAVRATDDYSRLRFPLFLREDLDHTGSLSPLLHTPAEVENALGRAALKGYRMEHLLLVEYFETADHEGRYRKYSAYVIGAAVFPRGMGLGQDWMMKADVIQFTDAMLEEEFRYAEGNPWGSQLRRIFQASGIEFGRMDFAVKDGRVETWEINLLPTIGPGRSLSWPDWVVSRRQPTRDLFDRRFREALEAIDTVRSAAPVTVRYSEECLREAVPMVWNHFGEGVLVRLARLASPLRPVFNAMARVAAPLVARLARRRATLAPRRPP